MFSKLNLLSITGVVRLDADDAWTFERADAIADAAPATTEVEPTRIDLIWPRESDKAAVLYNLIKSSDRPEVHQWQMPADVWYFFGGTMMGAVFT